MPDDMNEADCVPEAYRHYPKLCAPGSIVEIDGVRLKWYDIFAEADGMPAHMTELARQAVVREIAGSALDAGDLGFVILHRCGADFYFLLIQVWRGANELWEAVHYKDAATAGFSPFAPAYPTHGTPFRPTFCVWELGAVAFEARAWTAFLGSDRDAASIAHYLDVHYSGSV